METIALIPGLVSPLLAELKSNNRFIQFQNTLTILFILRILGKSLSGLLFIYRFGPFYALELLRTSSIKFIFKYLRLLLPSANKLIKQKIDESVSSIQKKLLPHDLPIVYDRLPIDGMTETKIRTEMVRYKKMDDPSWKLGKVSGAVYTDNEDLIGVVSEAFSMFCISNPLHPDLFSSIRQMESEIVSMTLNLYNAPSSACGNMTSGGTESLLMAVKTYRDMAFDRGITHPELIAPKTIHAAVNKAADYFKIHLHLIDVNPSTGQVLIKSGGYLVPFMDAAGFPLPYPVDFRQKGVTSISVDTHKYGFAPKGSSVIMYSSKEIRKFQYFCTTEWPGGVYASPSIAGSRPGALIAACWTALVYHGVNGYISSTKQIITCARSIATNISKITPLQVVGQPLMSVVAFKSMDSSINIFGIAEILTQKKWNLNVLQSPPAIHIAVTIPTIVGADNLISDIKFAVEELKRDPKKGKGEVAALYGTVTSVPDRTILRDVANGFLDALTMIKK